MDHVILNLIDVCKFTNARTSIDEGFAAVRDPAEVLHLKFLTSYMKIKELEHESNLQLPDISLCIQEFHEIKKEIKGYDTTENVLEFTCLENILVLLNARDSSKSENTEFLFELVQHLDKLCKIHWSDTSNTPPYISTCTDNENVLADSVKLIEKLSSEMSSSLNDQCFLLHYLSFLLDFSFWLLKNHQEDQLRRSVSNCISQILRSKHYLLLELDHGDNQLDVRFNKRSYQVIQRDHIALKLLSEVFAQHCTVEDGFYRKHQTSNDINNLLFTIEVVRLVHNADYLSCCQHISQVWKSNVSLSQLTRFELQLAKNINNICLLNLGKNAHFIDASSHYGGVPDMASILNQAGLYFVKEEYKKSVQLLYELLNQTEISSPAKVHTASNFEYTINDFLMNHITRVCPPVQLNQWKFYVHVNHLPLFHILYALSIMLFKLSRYDETIKVTQQLIHELDNNQSATTDVTVNLCTLYRRCCYSYLKRSRVDEAQNMITQLNDKGYTWVWLGFYESETLYEQIRCDESLQLLKRVLVQLKSAGKEEHLMRDVQDDFMSTLGQMEDLKTYHVCNNMAVIHMRLGRIKEGIAYLKDAIQQCRESKVDVIPEVVYNYCKWLHDNKSKKLANANWNCFYNTGTTMDFHGDYKSVT